MMWLTALKVLLVVVLVVGVSVLVLVGYRRSRANRADPRWGQPHQGQPGHVASIRGVMPTTPLPDWAEWEDHDNLDARSPRPHGDGDEGGRQ